MTDLLVHNAWIVPGADGVAPFRGALAASGGRIEALIPEGGALPEAAEAVCGLLEGAEQAACRRRVQSAHLQR